LVFYHILYTYTVKVYFLPFVSAHKGRRVRCPSCTVGPTYEANVYSTEKTQSTPINTANKTSHYAVIFLTMNTKEVTSF